MPDHFSIVSVPSGEEVRLVLQGELDHAAAPSLRESLEGTLDFAQRIVVDLDELDFIDSAGLCELLSALDRSSANGGRVWVTRGSAAVRQVLAIGGVDERRLPYADAR